MWHILYSVDDKNELEKALKKYEAKYNLNNGFTAVFKDFPPFAKDYGSYSSKAIKKLLPIMRKGKCWSEDEIDSNTQQRIKAIIEGDYLGMSPKRVLERLSGMKDVKDFVGLPLWLVCYVVYGRHSEVSLIERWNSPEDLKFYLRSFKQYSLRNPIVEQIVTETLRVVLDIWVQNEHIDEIHLELGREMKKTAEERKRMTNQIIDNEYANLRIKALLLEFMNPEYEIKNIRPYSPSQQDLLRIYEDTVLSTEKNIPDDISSTIRKFRESDVKKRPTKSECLRYKLWLEQKYRSPYTGDIIPLGELFTTSYQIEHIIPQSRYFDDSFSNKVICEAEVNRLKGNLLGYEFVVKHAKEIVSLGFGKKAKIFSVSEYEQFVQENYSKQKAKMKKLLLEELPEDFIERQLNDLRYISRFL